MCKVLCVWLWYNTLCSNLTHAHICKHNACTILYNIYPQINTMFFLILDVNSTRFNVFFYMPLPFLLIYLNPCLQFSYICPFLHLNTKGTSIYRYISVVIVLIVWFVIPIQAHLHLYGKSKSVQVHHQAYHVTL